MSHLEIAPQPSVPAIEPFAQRSRAEIIDRYRKFRAINRTHNNGALKFMSSEALMELARRLGILRGRKLILGSEDELALVNDLAFYGRQGGRKRPLDRYASSQRLSSDSDEARVLDAMLAARFVLIRFERRHPEAGLIVTDLLSDEEFWLVDEGMEASMPVGFKIATRVFSPEDFHMAAGAFVPLEGAILMGALDTPTAPVAHECGRGGPGSALCRGDLSRGHSRRRNGAGRFGVRRRKPAPAAAE